MDRRSLIKAAGLGALAFTVAGKTMFLSPRAARADRIPHAVLSEREVAVLEAFGDVLLPGAREDGIAHFVDHHLGLPHAESLLMIRYLDVAPPYAPFYKAGLAALDGHARKVSGVGFPELAPDMARDLVRAISRDNPDGWDGPPAPLFYFVVRSDAVDVVYGTEAGFEKLDIPYMAHLPPETKW